MKQVQEYQNTEFNDQGLLPQQSTEIIKEVLNVDLIIEKVDEFLSGEKIIQTIDKNGQPILSRIKYTKPKINNEGRYEIRRHLEVRLSKVFSLSDYGEREISNVLRVFGKNLLELLVVCKKSYNLSATHIPTLFHEIFDAVQATLNKSKEHLYIDFLKQSSRTIETRMFGNKSKDSGFDLYKKRRS